MKHSTQLPVAENVNRVLKDIAKRMGGGSVKVGFLEGKTYPDGTPVAAVAFWNEFGHEGPFPAPARPFFRTMISKEAPGWGATMAALAEQYDYDGPKVLASMGQIISEQLQESIINTNAPELSPTTLVLRARFWTDRDEITVKDVITAQKGAATGAERATGTQAKPLVWTGDMLRAVGFEVVT